MTKGKSRALLCSLLLIFSSVLVSSALVKNDFDDIIDSIISSVLPKSHETTSTTVASSVNMIASSAAFQPMFNTILANADEEVGCSENGFTIARYNLCGDFDDRTLTLSGGPYSSVQWQLIGGSCVTDINADCPNTDASCYTDVASTQSFTLDASSISSATGAEYRVVADGQQYFFKVKKSTINQTFVKRDYVCDLEGRIQITSLSSAYEYSINDGSGFGAWQSSPIFEPLNPGTYVVKARLQNTPNTCEYPYDPIVIDQLDLAIDVVVDDNVLCFGDTGDITVTAGGNVPGPFKYTLLDELGLPIEFTTFINDNPHTFTAVGIGSYSIQVETLDCRGDIANGILPPRQTVDVNGNPIDIGAGIVSLSASTTTNNSFATEPSCSPPSIDINIQTSGGLPPYTFTVSDGGNSGGSYTSSTTYAVSSPGDYDFEITDANGCTITASASIAELTPPDIAVAGIDGNCNNGGPKLDLTVLDAKGYGLSFRENASASWTTNTLLSVPAGTYNAIEVLYEQGGFSCVLILSDIVTVSDNGTIIGADPTWTDVSCSGSGSSVAGSITFPSTYTGGDGGPYEFSINGTDFFSYQTFNNLAAGTYNPTIRSASGCRRDFSAITISNNEAPTDIDFAQISSNCTANTSDVQLTAISSLPVLNYSIINPVSIDNGTSDTFLGLTNDTDYTFRVTDINGCSYEEIFTPVVVASIRARVKSGGNLNVCTGESDGEGGFIIDGFATDFTYNINGGIESTPQSTPNVDLSGLSAGTYTITVTDTESGCIDTATLAIQEPTIPLSVTIDMGDRSCENNNLGQVVANATGGFGSYNYELQWPSGTITGPNTSPAFSNLNEDGTYVLTVNDNEGCSVTTTFTLTSADAPSISLVSANYCFSPTTPGSIVVASTAGTAPISTHQYRINSEPLQASPNFSNLVPGTYSVQVVDNNGCSDSIQVIIPPQIQIDLNVISDIPCMGDGQMEVDIRGGDISNLASTSYTIFLDGIAVSGHIGQPLPSNPFIYNVPNASPGEYTVEVTDNNGCTNISPPLTFTTPPPIVVNENIVGPNCGDPSSGYVEIMPDVTFGTPPFEFVFAPVGAGLVDDPMNPDPSGTYAFSSQNIYSGLTAGSYEYLVKDARSCTTGVQTISVIPDPTNPPDATVTPIDAVCSTTILSGGVQITNIADGVPDFTIIIEDNFGNEILRREGVTLADLPLNIEDPLLLEGNYTVVTLDSRGCLDIDNVTIDSTNDLRIVPDLVVPPTCDRGNFPQCVDIVGGIGPFEIRLVADPPDTWITPNSAPRRHCFVGLAPGASYTIEVRDTATGCTTRETITIPDVMSPLDVDLTIDNGNCNGDLVALAYTITGFTGPSFDIIIANLDTGAEVFNGTTSSITDTFLVPQGPYSISVIDNGTDCTDGATTDAILNMPRVDVISNQNANCEELGQITVRGSGGIPFPSIGAGALPDGSPYLYAFVDQGVSPTMSDFTTDTTVFLPGSLAGTPYDIWVQDSRNCQFMTAVLVVQENPPLPDPIITVNNQCDVTIPVGGFTVEIEMPASIENPTFTFNGETQIPTYDPTQPTIATFMAPQIGSYSVYIIDANGCSVETMTEVYQILSASGGFSTTPTCENDDGIITITVNGGSGDFTYRLTGNDMNANPVDITDPDSDGVFPNLFPGTYQVLVTDNLVNDGISNCTTLVDNIISEAPVFPVIQQVVASDVSCNGNNDGSIDAVLTPNTDVDGIAEYRLYQTSLPLSPTDIPIATDLGGSFAGLGLGTYVVQVITNKGCTDEEEISLSEPPIFDITATDQTLVCESGVNRFSIATVSATLVSAGNGAPYGYRIDPADSYQSSPDFDIIDNGADQIITIYAVDSRGCEASVTVNVFSPTEVQPSIINTTPLTCTQPERVEISATGTPDFTVITTTPPGIAVADVSVSGGVSAIVELPQAGDYFFEIRDDRPNGCSYILPRYTVVPPTTPNALLSEGSPVVCHDDTNGSLLVEVTDYIGNYNYEAHLLDVDGNRTGSVFTGSSNTATSPTVISPLPAGSFEVDIIALDDPECTVTTNVATVRSPEPLVPDAIQLQDVGCDNDKGLLQASLQGGWDGSAYEYRLMRDDDTDGVFEAEIVTWGIDNEFANLSSGNYQVQYRDVEGCETTFDITLDPIDPIIAGIREPQDLVCPGGNNAILEAYDPTTGDALTALAGASGGVHNAGYVYRLVYLNSNDITDINSFGGPQSSPTFIGLSGEGYISAGWYAIEVSSGSDCIGFTPPYEVIPPPPIIPRLVQERAPGCGGSGIIRLFVENPEANFQYEYRLTSLAGGSASDSFTIMLDATGNPATEVLLNRPQGFYQYEIRKVNANNTCEPLESNGLTLLDANDIIFTSTPHFDVSCAGEMDGRIESFSSGGVGDNVYTLYRGDPVNAFSPSSSATVIQSNDFGTFEGLGPATNYYVAVTSGVTCQDIAGPITILDPLPILFTTQSTTVSCNGEEDGTITVEVTSGGEGLIQFAIGPNFDEFFSDPNTPSVYTFEDLSGDVNGTEYIILIQDESGCSAVTTTRVFSPEELRVVAEPTPELCLGLADGTTQLTVTGGTPFVDNTTGVSYYEVAVNSANEADYERSDSLFFDNLEGDTDYVFFVRDANLCTTNVIVNIGLGVDVNAEPIIEYGCEGIFPNNTVSIEPVTSSSMDDVLVLLDEDDVTKATDQMQWGDLEPGEHVAYLYHPNGCNTFVAFEIENYQPLSIDVARTDADEITVTAIGGFGGYEFFFQGESQGSDNIFNLFADSNIVVGVRDALGCYLEVVFPFIFDEKPDFPNFFTPNGDSYNNEWYPRNREFFPNIEVKIFDRYGRVVARLDQIEKWDGTYEGDPLPSGDYWYVANANDEKKQQFVGHFTLYR